jgi:hypothetical protein
VGDTLDGRRSSLLKALVAPACNTTGEVDLKRLLRGEPARWSQVLSAVAECDAGSPLVVMLVDLAFTCCKCRCDCVILAHRCIFILWPREGRGQAG